MKKIIMNKTQLKSLHTKNTNYSQGSLFREILNSRDMEALNYIKEHNPKGIMIDAYNIFYIFDSLRKDDFSLYTFFKDVLLEQNQKSKNSVIHFLIRDYHLLNNDKLKILNILYNDGFKDEEANKPSRNSLTQTSISVACKHNEFFIAKKLIEFGFPLEYKNNSSEAIFNLYDKALEESKKSDFNSPADRKFLIDYLLPRVTLPNTKQTPLICVLKSYFKNRNFEVFMNELKRLKTNKSLSFNITDGNLNIFSVLILLSTKENIIQFNEEFPDAFVDIPNKATFLNKFFEVDLNDSEYKIEYLKNKKIKFTNYDFENAFTQLYKSPLSNLKITSLLQKFHEQFKCVSSDLLFIITESLYSKERYLSKKSETMEQEYLNFTSMILKGKNINYVNSDGNSILHIISYNAHFNNFRQCVEHLLKNGFNYIDMPNKQGKRPIDLVNLDDIAYEVLDYYSEKNVLLRNISDDNDLKNNDTKKRRI